ncbi:unnamed protein product [Chrysoparadoxa australica]
MPMAPKDMRNGHNRVLTSQQLWLKAMSEKILMFQADTRLCSNSGRSIEDFIHLDWIGAPWDMSDIPKAPYIDGKALEVGNGALSLRSRSAMLAVTSEEHFEAIREAYQLKPYTPCCPSDIFFSFGLQWLNKEYPSRYQFQIASPDVAATFAIERPDPKWKDFHKGDVFGIHKGKGGWKAFVNGGLENMKELCPDAIPIFQRCVCGNCEFEQDTSWFSWFLG